MRAFERPGARVIAVGVAQVERLKSQAVRNRFAEFTREKGVSGAGREWNEIGNVERLRPFREDHLDMTAVDGSNDTESAAQRLHAIENLHSASQSGSKKSPALRSAPRRVVMRARADL